MSLRKNDSIKDYPSLRPLAVVTGYSEFHGLLERNSGGILDGILNRLPRGPHIEIIKPSTNASTLAQGEH